jgi:pimeloyl-ACP methyl ester carboxylesterase
MSSQSVARVFVLVADLAGVAALILLRPPPLVSLVVLAATWCAFRWAWPRKPRVAAAVLVVSTSLVLFRPHVDDAGYGRLYADQTYHHQALRALNHAAAQGADVSEVLETTRQVRAGDAQGWYAAWTALGDRNLARAQATRDPSSRGQALLRAHTYYLRSEFFLPPDDPKRPASFDRNRQAFYGGLDTLGIAYERIPVPFGTHHLNAVFYPAAAGGPVHAPLIVFCGGSDTTVEELYFFLAAAARARGYAVLTFEGPGQGAVLREEGLHMTPEWEKPTSAVLDAYLAGHARPPKIVLIGLSLGGYLAARAAAFEKRIDGVVSYDVFFDGAEVARRSVPAIAYTLRSAGLEWLVDELAPVKARFDPAAASGLVVAGWMLGTSRPLEMADALSTYTLAGVADRIDQDVLVFAGTEDQFVPATQVAEYTKALVHARSITTKVYDRESGGSEHSQIGAPTLWQADFFDWVSDKLEH